MKKLLVVGASGLVGQMVMEVLAEEKMISDFEITLASSSVSIGKVVMYNGRCFRFVYLSEKYIIRYIITRMPTTIAIGMSIILTADQ